MIFREIQMDMPFVNTDISQEDIYSIYESTWKEKRRRFQLMSRCMTSMIERLMPSIKTENYWKLLIECVEKNPRLECLNMLGVCSVQIVFNFESFFEMDNYQKKKYVLDKIMETIDYLSIKGLNEFVAIKPICDEVVRRDYLNEWFWNKPIKNEDKSVQIKVLHEVDYVSIFMVFTTETLTKEVLLVRDIPDEWIYSKYLGKVEWKSKNVAKLIAKDGTVICGEFC